MAAQHWLFKSEPSDYSFDRLRADRRTVWTGIRNFQARNFLRAAKKGDLALFFHTGDEKAVVGVARLLSGPLPDPTAKGEDWTSVELGPLKSLAAPVPLAAMKASAALEGVLMLKQGRLSVSPLSPAEFKAVLKLGKTAL